MRKKLPYWSNAAFGSQQATPRSSLPSAIIRADQVAPPSKLTDSISASAVWKLETTTTLFGLAGLTATVVSASLSAKPLMSRLGPTLRLAARTLDTWPMARTMPAMAGRKARRARERIIALLHD